jgi:hypothetical protein
VFDAVAHLLNPEVDLIFFDTTSTYFDFEIEQPDDPFGVTSTNASSTPTSTRTAPTAATVVRWRRGRRCERGSAPMGSRRTPATTSRRW